MNLAVIQNSSNKINYPILREEFKRAYHQINEDISAGKNPRKLRSLLSKPDSNTKLSKQTGRTAGYKLYSLFLAPSDLSGYNVCPWSSQECVKLCLNTSGRGMQRSVQQARIEKTQMMVKQPYDFMYSLLSEMCEAMRSSLKNIFNLAIRMNGTQDIPWEHVAPFISDFCKNGTTNQSFNELPKFRLYDYTKSFKRVMNRPDWYDMTFSFNGHNWKECVEVLNSRRGRVAVVFLDEIPEEYEGYEVLKGDLDDYRFLDEPGKIVGLLYKSTGKKNDQEVLSSCSSKPESFVIRL